VHTDFAIWNDPHFQRIADLIPAIVFVSGPNGGLLFVNARWCEYTGQTLTEARGQGWVSYVHPDDAASMIDLAHTASGQQQEAEFRCRGTDGTYRWFLMRSEPLFDTDGGLIGHLGTSRDTNDRRLAIDELREREALFRSIFESRISGLALADLDSGMIIEVNDRLIDMSGWPRDAFFADTHVWRTMTPSEFHHLDEAAIRQVLTRGTADPFEKELQRPDGTRIPVRIGSAFVAGERRQIIIQVEDISEERRRETELEEMNATLERRIAAAVAEAEHAQEALRQAQKMDALGRITGGVAHDFNNLLTPIVGGLDIIRSATSEEKTRRLAEGAWKAAERGTRLTAQLLAFSRTQRLDIRPTLVAPLVRDMEELFVGTLGGAVRLVFDLDEAGPVPVMADPTQLELVVLNLLINARDAMPEGGTVTIRTRQRRIDDDGELAPGDYVELTVIDQGMGMPPDVADRAFEPFFTTKPSGVGTGLGLSMVYGVARQSGGTARIRSEEGSGTSVSLYFARVEGNTEVDCAIAAPEASDEVSPASILVVDDNEEVRTFLAEALRESGHDILLCDDGRAALDILADRKFDLLILDYAMPGLDGAEVARRVREQAPDQPILFVTGYSQSAALDAAAADAPLLRKPFTASELQRAVRGCLSA